MKSAIVKTVLRIYARVSMVFSDGFLFCDNGLLISNGENMGHKTSQSLKACISA